jgi:DNA repair exonuclease SbcCD ATPase subunit
MRHVIFKSIEIQNFLSAGTEPIKVDFNKGFHVITGLNKDKQDRRNGVGKSTIADSINFAIYGNTLRELKKELIQNNLTNETCSVKLTLIIQTPNSNDEYFIHRTLAPNKCYIYKNGTDITLDSIANTNDHIKELINCTEDVFQNTVIMTINNTTPFMAKKKVEKRKFIEGIFNLGVFSEMISTLRSDYNDTKKELDIKSTIFTETDNSLKSYTQQHSNIIKERKDKLERYKLREQNNKRDLLDIKSKLVNVSEESVEKNNVYIKNLENKLPILSEKRDVCLKTITQIDYQNQHFEDQKNKLGTDDDTCPVCLHSIDNNDRNHIEDEKKKYDDKIQDNITKKDKVNVILTKVNTDTKLVKDIITELNNKNKNITQQINDQLILKEKAKQLNEWQNQLKIDIKELKNNDTGLDKVIEEYEDKLNKVKNELEVTNKKINMLEVVKFVVSEEGVKSFIVKKMLKIFNSRIAHYLKKMDSNCVCYFNEYFEEEIINEKGKICSYFNFSGAERKNIDLACLFSFMDIRRLQGDVTYNFSMYDELFDSSLDERGVELVINILKDRVDQFNECVMVISHRKESVKAAQGDVIFLEKDNGITRRVQYIE